VRTRFAPAPTGWLHLGHVLNAECVWTSGADVLLRIEDHDRARCRPEYEAGILDDLDWLGFRPAIHPTDAFRAGRCDGRQSDRDAVYRDAVEVLRAQGLVYACDCSRRDIVARSAGGPERSAVHEPGTCGPDLLHPADEPRYDGHCRDRGLPPVEGVGWRVRMDSGVERFVDRRLGAQEQDPSLQSGDVLIRDRAGNWTYQFCASVDDFRQGIDLVIRGEDLLPSTGRQIRLAWLLGRATPAAFLHHPLIMKSRDQKLSKSNGDTGVMELRAGGWTAESIRRAAREAPHSLPAPHDRRGIPSRPVA
jgi:glutamyl-Q tRNA(Asp) synthetase